MPITLCEALFGLSAWFHIVIVTCDCQSFRPKSSLTESEPKITGNSLSEINLLRPPSEHRNQTLFSRLLALLPCFCPLFAHHQKLCTIHPLFFFFFHHLLLFSTQPSAATTPAPPCSPWPRGTSCSSQAAGRVGSASWSCRTSSSARASRPTTLQSKLWPWTRRRTASSAAHRRETSG